MADHDDNDADEQLPLRGVVLCCTSLPQDARLKFAAYAQEMGAEHTLDLTTHVTHLIVGCITTPKYRYVAKDRPDIKVVSASWLEVIRERWMAGEDVDITALEQEHKLGVFFGLKICITGFDDLERRSYISNAVEQQGAEYSGDLTKSITHLIAAAPKGAKYDHARLWKIPIVSDKWFDDSLRRGMILEESLYEPTMPVEEQGKGAFKTMGKPSAGVKRRREGESQGIEAGSRKLRRTVSSRMNSQSQEMWSDLSTTMSVAAPSERDQWNDQSEPNRAVPQRRPSLEKVHVRRSEISLLDTEPAPAGVFAGCHVLIRGFPRDRVSLLLSFLEPQGAVIVQTPEGLEASAQNSHFRAGYLLMPHTFEATPMQPPGVPEGTATVTEWWVERCLLSKTLIEPASDPLSRPLWDAKISDLAGLSICTTGFGADFRQTAEAIKLMGAEYAEKLVPSVAVLVSGSEAVKKEKAYYAAKHNISVVSATWLWECLRTKQRLAYSDFAVKLPAFDAKEVVGEPTTSSPPPSSMLHSKSDRFTKKSDNAPKRLSNTRHRSSTPTLALQAHTPATARVPRKSGLSVHQDEDAQSAEAVERPTSRAGSAPSVRPSRRSGPFVLEDEDDTSIVEDTVPLDLPPAPKLEPSRSQPLQEISPNASPRKSGQSQDKTVAKAELRVTEAFAPSPPESDALPMSPKSPRQQSAHESLPPPPKQRQELTADLAALLHHRTSSRSDSMPAEPQPPPKRKNRPLGRSASGMNARSVSASAQSDHAGSPQEVTGDAADGFTSFTREAQGPPPGTQLGYEDPEAREHQAKMEKVMKVDLRDESAGTRVASVGAVKDSFAGGGGGKAGVGERVRGRNRAKP